MYSKDAPRQCRDTLLKQAMFLGEAIDSVLAQTYRHFEIIVINDGSPKLSTFDLHVIAAVTMGCFSLLLLHASVQRKSCSGRL